MQSVSNNEYGIPDIPKQTFKKVPENLCASAYGAKTKYPALVHFFIEDRRFESVWTHPVRSLNKLADEKTWAVRPVSSPQVQTKKRYSGFFIFN